MRAIRVPESVAAVVVAVVVAAGEIGAESWGCVRQVRRPGSESEIASGMVTVIGLSSARLETYDLRILRQRGCSDLEDRGLASLLVVGAGLVPAGNLVIEVAARPVVATCRSLLPLRRPSCHYSTNFSSPRRLKRCCARCSMLR